MLGRIDVDRLAERNYGRRAAVCTRAATFSGVFTKKPGPVEGAGCIFLTEVTMVDGRPTSRSDLSTIIAADEIVAITLEGDL